MLQCPATILTKGPTGMLVAAYCDGFLIALVGTMTIMSLL